MAEISFEKALKELEHIVKQLEKGDLSLEQNLALYEKGTKLAKYCSDTLHNAELKVEEMHIEK